MKRLSEMKKGEEGIISSVNGDTRYIGRITSIGITPGCKVKIIKNDKNRPIIVFSRDTMITSELNTPTTSDGTSDPTCAPIPNELSVRVGGQRGLAGAGQAEEHG